jgi:hypothetical protein
MINFLRTILFALIMFITGCTKTNSIVIENWQVENQTDTATIDHAYFCSGKPFTSIIPVIFNNNSPNKNYSLTGTIVVVSAVHYIDNLYIRTYYLYVKQVF